MTRRTRLPAIPSSTDATLSSVVDALKEIVEVREGRRADPMEQSVTFRDLEALGLAVTPGSLNLSRSPPDTGLPVVPPPWVNPWPWDNNYNPETDYAIPPAPTDLIAVGSYSAISLSWSYPVYRNHAYFEVWRSTADSFGTAVMVGTNQPPIYNDPVGTERTYYYWVRSVSRANVKSEFNSLAGTGASTALDVARRIEILEGAISNDALTRELGERISLLETAQGTFARSYSQFTANQGSLTQQLISNVGANSVAIQTQQRVADGLSAQYTVKIDNNGHVSGFGLASRYVNGTPVSAFIIRADRFAIVSPTDTSDNLTLTPASAKVPFVVLTTPTVIDGLTYPAGTYIKTAFIADATITSAKVQSLSADKITAGTIAASVMMTAPTVKSGNIAFGQSGFFLGYDSGTPKLYVGDGVNNYVQYNGTSLSVRGNLIADSGTFRNITVYDTNNNIILSSGGLVLPGGIYNTDITINGSGQLLGIGTGAATTVSNNQITINGSGQITGIGSGANTTVANSQITINSNGTLSGAGAGQVTLGGLGAGALATANSVFIGSTVRFSDNSLMNTGDFVNRLSQITQGNVSTFIASGAIGEAYIGNLSAAKITSGTIASDRLDSTIINAKVTNIDAAVIGSGTIANARVGDIQSVNYVSGSTGWAIFKNIGNAEFSNVWVRGTSAVQRLVVTGTVSGSVFVANNSTATVTHNENRNIVVSIWSTAGSATLTDNSLNSFTVRLDNSAGGNVFYKYF